jgi:hypothetical protein
MRESIYKEAQPRFEDVEIFYLAGNEYLYYTIYDIFCRAVINEVTLSTYPVQIAKLEAGLETRRILNPLPSGALIMLEIPFISCEESKALIAFWDSRLGNSYPFILPFDLRIMSYLPCGFIEHLPSNLWRFEGEVKFTREEGGYWSIQRLVLVNLIGESIE